MTDDVAALMIVFFPLPLHVPWRVSAPSNGLLPDRWHRGTLQAVSIRTVPWEGSDPEFLLSST